MSLSTLWQGSLSLANPAILNRSRELHGFKIILVLSCTVVGHSDTHVLSIWDIIETLETCFPIRITDSVYPL